MELPDSAQLVWTRSKVECSPEVGRHFPIPFSDHPPSSGNQPLEANSDMPLPHDIIRVPKRIPQKDTVVPSNGLDHHPDPGHSLLCPHQDCGAQVAVPSSRRWMQSITHRARSTMSLAKAKSDDFLKFRSTMHAGRKEACLNVAHPGQGRRQWYIRQRKKDQWAPTAQRGRHCRVWTRP